MLKIYNTLFQTEEISFQDNHLREDNQGKEIYIKHLDESSSGVLFRNEVKELVPKLIEWLKIRAYEDCRGNITGIHYCGLPVGGCTGIYEEKNVSTKPDSSI